MKVLQDEKQTILVVGSFNVDLSLRVERFPQPGETLEATALTRGPGGKGFNQAVAAARSGGRVQAAFKIGRDAEGELARSLAAQEPFTATRFFESDAPTGMAMIEVEEASGENRIAILHGANFDLSDADLAAVEAWMGEEEQNIGRTGDRKSEAGCGGRGFLLLQNEIPAAVNLKLARMAVRHGVKVVYNPAPAAALPAELAKRLFLITPNQHECERICGIAPRGPEACQAAAEVFFAMGLQKVVITLGAQGVFAAEKGRSALIPAFPVCPVDTTGAGDALNGALCTALSEGEDLLSACRFAAAAAALAVMRWGAAAAMPAREDIEALLISSCERV